MFLETNKEMKNNFNTPDGHKAWEIVKRRGKANGTLFFEDGRWHYWANN